MLKAAFDFWRPNSSSNEGFVFNRPLVLIQSDDWGRVGIRDEEGFEQLRSVGIRLGEKAYDFYTLETADDVTALGDLLKSHEDFSGRSPCLEMNFILANIDFQKTFDNQLRDVPLRPLCDGLPGKWNRPRLFEAYVEGIAAGIFYPALHGLTHFSKAAAERCLARKDNRHELLRTFWKTETPYIHWRMPWIGYEYWDPENRPDERFISRADQHCLVHRAVELFTKLFSVPPCSACAPGYRANANTYSAFVQNGIRIAQSGTRQLQAPYIDSHGLLQISRTIDFEPATYPSFCVDDALRAADDCFAHGIPAVLSLHAINFHSSLKNFRDQTVLHLDQFLCSLKKKHPDLLYVHDADLWEIVNTGKYQTDGGTLRVRVKQQKPAAAYRSAATGS